MPHSRSTDKKNKIAAEVRNVDLIKFIQKRAASYRAPAPPAC